MKEAVIVSAVRTPLGSFNGSLGNMGPPSWERLLLKKPSKEPASKKVPLTKPSWVSCFPAVMAKIRPNRRPSRPICHGRSNVSRSIKFADPL